MHCECACTRALPVLTINVGRLCAAGDEVVGLPEVQVVQALHLQHQHDIDRVVTIIQCISCITMTHDLNVESLQLIQINIISCMLNQLLCVYTSKLMTKNLV